MGSSGAIGVFDSGIGGVSVLNACMEILPNEDFVYYADSKNAPYGDKSDAEIIKLMDNVMTVFFIPKGVRALVIACNTATNVAIDYMRRKYTDIVIVGIEPAIKPAIDNSRKKVLVLATKKTVESKKYNDNLERLSSGSEDVISMQCSGLVELIESDNDSEIKRFFEKKFQNIMCSDIDAVVLGCTHYPFAKETIQSFFDTDTLIIDGSFGVAKRLKSLLYPNGYCDERFGSGRVLVDSSMYSKYNEKILGYVRRV